MANIPYAIITTKFLDKNRQEGPKEYKYLIDEDQYRLLLTESISCNLSSSFPTYYIENEEGYNYRNSEVIILKGNLIKDPSEAGRFKTLREIRRSGRVYIGQTSPSFEVSLNKEIQNITTSIKPTSLVSTQNSVYSIDAYASASLPLSNLTERLDKIEDTIYKERNNKMFKNVMRDVEFGKATDVRMSIYGPAFPSYGGQVGKPSYLSFDGKNDTYVDVTDMLLDIENLCYVAPIAKRDLHKGDFIRHNSGWARVIGEDDAGRAIVEKIISKEIVTILPTKNIFGFDFYTKLYSYSDNLFNASPDSPFGNMLPLLMLNDENEENKNMLPMLMMMNGMGMNTTMSFDMSNPMFLYMMLDKGDESMRDMMMMMAMMNMNKKD